MKDVTSHMAGVGIVSAANMKSPPVVFLSGGPGGTGLSSISTWAPSAWSAANADRNFVVFDQRGTGEAEHALFCPERDEAFAALSATTADPRAFTDGMREAQGRCYDRLVAEGRDLAGYSSAASARDVCDLVPALGYDQYNVYGVSYGTRLAQTIMRDVPQGLRSAILDGVVPVGDQPQTSRRSFEVAMGTLLANCQADPSCSAAYPGLETTLYGLIASLNASPHTAQWTDAQTAEAHTVIVTGDRLLAGGLEGAIRNPAFIPLLPQFFAATAAGDMTLLEAQTPGAVAPSTTAVGAQLSVRCRDDRFAHGAGAEDAQREEYRRAVPLIEVDLCDTTWPLPPPSAIESEPVSSSVPTLLLSGEYDPITPSPSADAVAQHLSVSQRFLIPNLGHGTVRATSPDGVAGQCARQLAQAFVDAPTGPLDASCIATIPPVAFAVPAPAP